MPRATGEFHGAMMPATPTGWRTTMLISPSVTWLLVPVSVSASAALNRSVSGANATSSRPWSCVLPFSRPSTSTRSSARSSNRSAIRFSTFARSSRFVRHAGSANARLAASIAACASLGPAMAYEPMTSPVAGLTDSRCSHG